MRNLLLIAILAAFVACPSVVADEPTDPAAPEPAPEPAPDTTESPPEGTEETYSVTVTPPAVQLPKWFSPTPIQPMIPTIQVPKPQVPKLPTLPEPRELRPVAALLDTVEERLPEPVGPCVSIGPICIPDVVHDEIICTGPGTHGDSPVGPSPGGIIGISVGGPSHDGYGPYQGIGVTLDGGCRSSS